MRNPCLIDMAKLKLLDLQVRPTGGQRSMNINAIILFIHVSNMIGSISVGNMAVNKKRTIPYFNIAIGTSR